MVQIKLLKGEIEISSDKKIENEDDLLIELTSILCFVITIYKRRLEKLRKNKLSELDEAIVNKRIRDSIAMIPVNEVREFIKETNLDSVNN